MHRLPKLTTIALLLLLGALALSACGDSTDSNSADDFDFPDAVFGDEDAVGDDGDTGLPGPADAQTVGNRGDNTEGHTPTEFQGSGSGLIAGDNLNADFPDTSGVQLFISFDYQPTSSVGTATVTSDALQVQGSPLEDLGEIRIEPVTYDAFGPNLWNLVNDANPVPCDVDVEAGTFSCDVSDPVAQRSAQGVTQFRILFETPTDGDGQQDLVLFNRGDSNANEPGIFELTIEPAF